MKNNNNKKNKQTEKNCIITVWFDKGNKVLTTDITVDFSKFINFCYKNLF